MYEIFKRLMEEKGITAYKVSKDTGISSQTLSAWKKDIYTPKREKMELIANYFGVSVDYLMGRTPYRNVPDLPEPPLTEIVDEPELTLQEKRALELFRKLNKEQSEQAVKIMEQFAKLNDMVNSYGEKAKEHIDKINHAKQ